MSAPDPSIPKLGPDVRVSTCARLADATTFRLGGFCRARVDCESSTALVDVVARLRSESIPFILMGGGSNLLVSDKGLDAVIVRFSSDRPDPARLGCDVVVGAQTGLDSLAMFCGREGLDGLRFATGIPGTVGGAVAGNAGAFGEDIASRIASLTVLEPDGSVREVPPTRFRFAYRHSDIGDRGSILLSVQFRLSPAPVDTLSAERQRILAFRAERHPDWHKLPTAGSYFRNIEPTSAAGRRQAAGWYLEQAGAKAMREGGARVYEKHANIVIADGPGCTAADVWKLAGRMSESVKQMFGLELIPEVRWLGTVPE